MLLLSILLTLVLILRWFTAVRIRKLRSSFQRADNSVCALKKQSATLRAESMDVRNQLKHLEARRVRLITEMDESREELRLLREERDQRDRRIAA